LLILRIITIFAKITAEKCIITTFFRT
jgi:hypothetical protein